MTPADLTEPNISTAPPLAVSEPEAARLIGVSARTMFNWRAAGTGPRVVRAGGRVLYAVDELRRWLNATAGDALNDGQQPAVQAISGPPSSSAATANAGTASPAEQAKTPRLGGGR